MQTSPVLTADDELMERAKRRVALKTGFATHALVFVLVNLGLYAFARLGGGDQGRFFPLWGWGLGLLIHGVVTLAALSGDGLRARMLDAEVRRLQQRG